MNELCDLFGIEKDMKDALMIAAALHDIGQIENRKEHGKKAAQYIEKNYKDVLEKNKYYNDILKAIEEHSEESRVEDPLFTVLLQAADKFDFSKTRLEDGADFFTKAIEKVEYIYDDTYFGLNIITKDIDNFEELFLAEHFFSRVINIVRVLAIKYNRKPIIKENDKVLEKVVF